ncbi:MAG: glucosylceramidase [Dysgonamonadaceae bacterium]|jgi:glucosylceramidase|nr:glucosylceramidase [Dysgonamonadaceae bacterium]
MDTIFNLKNFLPIICFFMGIQFSSCNEIKDNNTDDGTDSNKPEAEDVVLYITTNTRSFDFRKLTTTFSDKDNMSPSTIKLEPTTRYQTMDGFGAAVTGSSCFNLLKMQPADRTRFLKATFSPTEGMGYSYVRISIGCSDFSLSEYTCWDDTTAGFALTSEENDYVIPVLKEILAIHPKLKILGSPWTCPRWMKVNNLEELKSYESWTSGRLNPAYYQDYATYFVKWIQAFARAGIVVDAVTPQNEPLNRGNSASLFMGWQEQRDFVKNALTPQFKAAGLKTKIYLFDHNYNYDNMGDQNAYPVKIYDAGVEDEWVVGAAYHNYGGSRNELLDIHNLYPNKELIFTESSIGTWNDGHNLSVRLMEDMQEVALGTVNNWCKAVIVWNLMLDSERGPNRAGGCQTCYGAVDIDRSDYKTITKNSHYYIIGHLSAVVKPGAIRIGTSGYKAAGVSCSAFENTDGTYSAVLLNNTDESKKITLDDGKRHFSYDVPSKSVISYQWKK